MLKQLVSFEFFRGVDNRSQRVNKYANKLNVVNEFIHSEFFKKGLKVLFLTLFYYCFSISLTFYNQKFIHKYRYPLSITMVHLIVKFVLAGFIRSLIVCYTGKKRVLLSWKPFVCRVAPPGVASSLDIALSNWSFEYITVSLYTMTKSTVILFILAFSLAFRLEKPQCGLVFVVMFIASGLFLFTYESTQFVMKGFLMVLTASFLSGLRWTLAQLVLQKSDLGLSNPLDMMYHIQPWMIITLLPLSAGFEGLAIATTREIFAYTSTVVIVHNMLILMLGAGLAFMLELSEFLLVVQTSSLTLSIAGIVKEICTLILASKINNDQMSNTNILGLVICMIGIAIHIRLKTKSDKLLRKSPDHANLLSEDISSEEETCYSRKPAVT